MHWSERMKTKIEVGKTYENRNGAKWRVVSELKDEQFETHKLPPPKGFVDISTTKELVVNKYGGFGNYPNHFDLVKLV
jgi:hypothetical protein